MAAANKKSAQGFTLLEFSMVLVVIGLLAGATFTGQQLITGAHTKRTVAQARDVTAAYLVYLDRYGAVPGDDPNASSRWPQAKDGNGDRRISGSFDAAPPMDPAALVVTGDEGESLNFWWHLRLAGLLTGSQDGPLSPPRHPVGGTIGIQEGAYGLRGTALCFAGLPAQIAATVDRHSDDEYPDRGSVRAAREAVGTPTSAYPTTDEPYTMCVSIDGSSGGRVAALDPGVSAPADPVSDPLGGSDPTGTDPTATEPTGGGWTGGGGYGGYGGHGGGGHH
jgi:prepilin-type N-terminal cleavage/methylation domain-containing protein